MRAAHTRDAQRDRSACSFSGHQVAIPEVPPHRWDGIERTYTPAQVGELQGTMRVEYTFARHGADRLWRLLRAEPYLPALGALTGGQAVQQVRAGLPVIYVSGWQVAADANLARATYPDQSLYPSNSVPELVRRMNAALQRADQIDQLEGCHDGRCWFAPVIADAEAGFGGHLNAYELMRSMIEAGAAGVHFEDQLAAEKCGHLGGKVLLPTQQFVQMLNAARLATDVCGVPSIIIARTDADSAQLITSDIDPRDHPFITGERTAEGFYRFRGGLEASIARALVYARYADLLWCEVATPDLHQARQFAEAVHEHYPGKFLAYNCSPSFNWGAHLSAADIAAFQQELAAMGYKFQFVTLAGFHQLNHGMFDLALNYRKRGMSAYVALQSAEIASEEHGYTATRHQREVGTSVFDAITRIIKGDGNSTAAMEASTEQTQFTSLLAQDIE